MTQDQDQSRGQTRWLVSPTFDLGWFIVPGALAILAAIAIAVFDPAEPSEDGESLALWIVGVLLVDVAHVWASLYRTWLDAEARSLHAPVLRAAPLLVFVLGFLTHAASPPVFWTVLAYVAVFHFIKQQEGFAMIYLRAEALGQARPQVDSGEPAAIPSVDRWLTKAAIWSSTAGPVLWWHAHLPRRFAWFMADDFVSGLPALAGEIAVWVQVPALALFVGRRVARRLRGSHRAHPMVGLLVGLTALSWNLGIVAFNDDRVFTVTNVFIHGVPYLALVWLTGGRERVEAGLERVGLRELGVVGLAALFYGLTVALAVTEEALWDRLVWHDHEPLFGVGRLDLDALGTALVVAALTVPQATHYLLDRWIWRVGPKNPRLAAQLRLS